MDTLTARDRQFVELLHTFDFNTPEGAAFFAVLSAAAAKTSPERAAEVEADIPAVFGMYSRGQLQEALRILVDMYTEYERAGDRLRVSMIEDAFYFIQSHLLENKNPLTETATPQAGKA